MIPDSSRQMEKEKNEGGARLADLCDTRSELNSFFQCHLVEYFASSSYTAEHCGLQFLHAMGNARCLMRRLEDAAGHFEFAALRSAGRHSSHVAWRITGWKYSKSSDAIYDDLLAGQYLAWIMGIQRQN